MRCPVCRGSDVEPGIYLARQPVYQHPVSPGEGIDPPWFQDLDYRFCRGCEHAFLETEDGAVLTRLYRKYYYTPRPRGLGTQFQETFFRVVDREFDGFEDAENIMEIGCSSGEMMEKISQAYPQKILVGFEPNKETAKTAGERGFHVQESFFTREAVGKMNRRFDLIFHRHVIEHILDFDDFFKAHDLIRGPGAKLVIETPCLNHAVDRLSLAPFHIEHRHLFSLSSLGALMARYGWILEDYRLTDHGAVIGLFAGSGTPCSAGLKPVGGLGALGNWVGEKREIIARASRGKRLALWGAGSGGVKAMNYFGLSPEALVDGNPEKAGKHFVGFDHLTITDAAPWIEKERSCSRDWLILVSSTYHREIRDRLSRYGWEGELISLYGD